jgi:uncharacterized protein YbcI
LILDLRSVSFLDVNEAFVDPHSAAEAISAAVADIHAAAYERQSERASTLLEDDLAMCILRTTLTPAESLLVANGHREAVHDQRQAFEQTLAPALRAAVERITTRTVTSFLPTTHLAPSLTLFTFGFAARRIAP